MTGSKQERTTMDDPKEKYSISDIGEAIDLIMGGDRFGMVAMQGLYSLPRSVFKIGVEAALREGIDVLDEHAFIVGAFWDTNHPEVGLLDADLERLESLLDGGSFWDLDSFSDYGTRNDLELLARKQRELRSRQESYLERRRKANRYVQKKKVREAVFKRDGFVCAECGTHRDLSLDHIVPVVAGGEDRLDNLQVLCRSCNSSKGGGK
jgi:5-methylcytosine-specific restriction endonuclease McrA